MRSTVLLGLPFLVGLVGLVGCADLTPDHVDLVPAGEAVDFVYETPSPSAYKMVGEVKSAAEGVDAEAAEEAARNDLRNKAGALGATLVSIDQKLGEPVLLRSKTKVTLVGRAFKALD
jgi:hypothetical protein